MKNGKAIWAEKHKGFGTLKVHTPEGEIYRLYHRTPSDRLVHENEIERALASWNYSGYTIEKIKL